MNNVEIACGILFETDNAFKIYDGAVIIWIPKSQIVEVVEVRGAIEALVIPEWLANAKGLI